MECDSLAYRGLKAKYFVMCDFLNAPMCDFLQAKYFPMCDFLIFGEVWIKMEDWQWGEGKDMG